MARKVTARITASHGSICQNASMAHGRAARCRTAARRRCELTTSRDQQLEHERERAAGRSSTRRYWAGTWLVTPRSAALGPGRRAAAWRGTASNDARLFRGRQAGAARQAEAALNSRSATAAAADPQPPRTPAAGASASTPAAPRCSCASSARRTVAAVAPNSAGIDGDAGQPAVRAAVGRLRHEARARAGRASARGSAR